MNRVRRQRVLTGVLWLAVVSLLPQAAMSADEELLQILLDNGAITEEQYGQLREKEKLTAKEFQDIKVSVGTKGLRAEMADGRFSLRLGGRVHAQAAGHSGRIESDATDGTEIRRARFDLESTIHEYWRWKGEVDFADNEVSVKDFFVGYTGFEWANFFAGHQKQPFSLALEMSSNDLPFIERGVDTDLLVPFVDRAIGIRADSSGEHWQISAGIYGSGASPETSGNEGWGATTRWVFAPIRDENRVLHLGARAAYREPSNGETRIRAETSHLSNLFTTDSDDLAGIGRAVFFGPEAAFAWGPFSVGGEYNHAILQRGGSGDLTFDSWPVAATWSITGESRAGSYKMGSGEFKRLKPEDPFSLSGGGLGAWELAFRFASLDLKDDEIDGGKQQSITLALNWYLNQNIRLMLDWSRILNTGIANRRAEDLDIIQSRVEFSF